MNKSLKYNNLTMVLYIVINTIKQKGEIDLLRLSVLTTLLLDDSIVEVLNNSEETPTFANLRVTNRYMMANVNKRFYSTLPLVVDALSILLDADCVTVDDGNVNKRGNIERFTFDVVTEDNGRSAVCINHAVPQLLNLTEEISTKRMIQILNILV
jgi:hypothetical protein